MHCWELIDHRIFIPYTRAAFSISLDRQSSTALRFLFLIFLFYVYVRQTGYGMSGFSHQLLGMAIWEFDKSPYPVGIDRTALNLLLAGGWWRRRLLFFISPLMSALLSFQILHFSSVLVMCTHLF
jgi:hypothetical protein